MVSSYKLLWPRLIEGCVPVGKFCNAGRGNGVRYGFQGLAGGNGEGRANGYGDGGGYGDGYSYGDDNGSGSGAGRNYGKST